MYNKSFKSLLFSGMVAATFIVTGCDSGDTSTEDRVDDSATQFVADESNTGTIDLKIKDDPVAVGSTGRFIVEVRDSTGTPVRNVRIACDSEGALAILDPTTGSALTDDFGNMSGTFGCEAPGSFQLGCRLPIGANRRDFEIVHCTGDIPEGFTGFGESGGSGVGGGVDTTDESINESSNVRINTIRWIDGTEQEPGTSIDNFFNPDCDGDATTPDPEFFTDTLIAINMENSGETTFRADSFRFTARQNEGGFRYESPSLGVTSDIPGGSSTTINSLFADAANDKRFVGDTRAIPSGTYTVNVTVFGRDGSGNRVRISGSSVVSVDNFNNCN